MRKYRLVAETNERGRSVSTQSPYYSLLLCLTPACRVPRGPNVTHRRWRSSTASCSQGHCACAQQGSKYCKRRRQQSRRASALLKIMICSVAKFAHGEGISSTMKAMFSGCERTLTYVSLEVVCVTFSLVSRWTVRYSQQTRPFADRNLQKPGCSPAESVTRSACGKTKIHTHHGYTRLVPKIENAAYWARPRIHLLVVSSCQKIWIFFSFFPGKRPMPRLLLACAKMDQWTGEISHKVNAS